MSSNIRCSRFLEPKLYPRHQLYIRNKAQKLSSQMVIVTSFVLSLSAVHKYKNLSGLFQQERDIFHFREAPWEHRGKLLFCPGTQSGALNITLKPGAPASRCLHTVTTMQFEQGVTRLHFTSLLCFLRMHNVELLALQILVEENT